MCLPKRPGTLLPGRTYEITGRSYRLKDKARQRPKEACKEGKEAV
jgi:hypothetical protein